MSDIDRALEQAIDRAYHGVADPDAARLAAILARVEREAAPRAARKRFAWWVVLPLVFGAAAAVAGYVWLVQEQKAVHPVAAESPVEAAPANGAEPPPESRRDSAPGAAGSKSSGRGIVIFRSE